MNIFASDSCPIKSAILLDNKRLVKMVLESAQLLCTAVNLRGGVAPYKSTHINHPVAIWTRQTKSNYAWLLNHFKALCTEYTIRYGKIHKCYEHYEQLQQLSVYIPDGALTPHANCARNLSIGVDFSHVEDVYKAYTLYLQQRWKLDKRAPMWGTEFVCPDLKTEQNQLVA